MLIMVMIMDSNFSNYDVGNRIRELRTKMKLSQESLALNAKITPAYLGQIERGQKNPTIALLEKICRALHISLTDFFESSSSSKMPFDAPTSQILQLLAQRSVKEKEYIAHMISELNSLLDSD